MDNCPDEEFPGPQAVSFVTRGGAYTSPWSRRNRGWTESTSFSWCPGVPPRCQRCRKL